VASGILNAGAAAFPQRAQRKNWRAEHAKAVALRPLRDLSDHRVENPR